MSKTSIPLKNLRGTLLLLIVAFHAFSACIVSQPALAPAFDQPPYDWRIFPIVDNERWLGFDLFCAFQFLYLMQFMFFLSGLFVWSSLQRKSWREFLVHRFARLGVPFVIGVYALMPLTFFPVYRVTAIDPSWSAFWAHWMALPTNPTGPMWFLWCLIVLDVIGVAIYQLAPHTKQYVAPLLADAMTRPGMLFAALLCVSALAYLPLSAIYSPWHWIDVGPFEVQATFAPQYVIYFLFGLVVGAHGFDRGTFAIGGRVVRHWPLWAIGTVAAFCLWIIPAALIRKVPGAPVVASATSGS